MPGTLCVVCDFVKHDFFYGLDEVRPVIIIRKVFGAAVDFYFCFGGSAGLKDFPECLD